MVATGSGNYHDIASAYRVMNRYTELVKGDPIETPLAAMDSRDTLIQQQKELERQRREIEQLRRELEQARGGNCEILAVPESDNNEADDAPSRKRPRAAAKRKQAARRSQPSTASNVTVEGSTMREGQEENSSIIDGSILTNMGMDEMVNMNDVTADMGSEILSSSTDAEIDAEIDQAFGDRGADGPNQEHKSHHTRNRSGEWSTMLSMPDQTPQLESLVANMMSVDEVDSAFDSRKPSLAAQPLHEASCPANAQPMPSFGSILGGCIP